MRLSAKEIYGQKSRKFSTKSAYCRRVKLSSFGTKFDVEVHARGDNTLCTCRLFMGHIFDSSRLFDVPTVLPAN